MRADAATRLWSRVEFTRGCWLWLGPTWEGYGQIRQAGRWIKVHRLAYLLLVGPIPEGRVLDHLCRVRNCVRPSHLEPVTTQQNTLRGVSPFARNAAKTQCPEGHPYDDTNTAIERPNSRSPRRRCITCRRARKRRAA